MKKTSSDTDQISGSYFLGFLIFGFTLAIFSSIFLSVILTLSFIIINKIIVTEYKNSSLSQPIYHNIKNDEEISLYNNTQPVTNKNTELTASTSTESDYSSMDRLYNRYWKFKDLTFNLLFWFIISFFIVLLMAFTKNDPITILSVLIFLFILFLLPFFIIYTLWLKIRIHFRILYYPETSLQDIPIRLMPNKTEISNIKETYSPQQPIAQNSGRSTPQQKLSFLEEFMEYRKTVALQLRIRHRKQLSDIHHIFVDNSIKVKKLSIKIRVEIEQIHLLSFQKLQQNIQQYLTYHKDTRLLFNQDLQQVPDMWLTKQFEQIIEQLVLQSQHLYLQDMQSFIDHSEFLEKRLNPEQSFLVGKDLDNK